MSDPAAVLSRLTGRLAPLERDLHRAFWAASTKAGPETSAARQRAGDPGMWRVLDRAANRLDHVCWADVTKRGYCITVLTADDVTGLLS